MRIVSLDIPSDKIGNGLQPIRMDKLGQIVLLAGKNGSGKSRLFDTVEANITENPLKRSYLNLKGRIVALTNDINRTKAAFIEPRLMGYRFDFDNPNVNVEDELEKYGEQIGLNWDGIPQVRNLLKNREQVIQQIKGIESYNHIVADDIYDEYTVVRFVPKALNISDPSGFNGKQMKTSAMKIDTVGVDHLSAGTLARIQLIQNRWSEATHQNARHSSEEIAEAKEEYNRLSDLIKIFLNTELDRNLEGDATLFGFNLSNLRLSDGQKILLQFCLAIHCQQKSLDELVLFMDEPENHLHPSVIIDIIERLREKTSKGQIWIATHSIPILAHFDPSSIWWVDEGKVSYAGNAPEKVLSSLLGNESRIGELQDFISLPGIMALNRHAYESLFHPEAVTTGKDDPQGLQIREEIEKYLKDKGKIRILDYGAGKGRLLANILENNSDADLANKIDYIAFDKYNTDEKDCKDVIERMYGNSDNRYYNDLTKLYAEHGKETFDIVVLCNVLHEVDPKDWLRLFKEEMKDILRNSGAVLIVEDQEMPIGEKAYQKGFIVLDTQDLRDLFVITEHDKDFKQPNSAKNGRLKAHLIQKEYLLRVTSESRVRTLRSIQTNAKAKVLDIRGKDINYKNGKVHGFWVQQLANTTLSLQELE